MDNVYEITTGEAIPTDLLLDSDPVRIYAERNLKSPWRFPDKHTGLPTITLAVIARDDEQTIASCLESVKGIVDEILVLNSGATGRALEIAQNYGAKIIPRESPADLADAQVLAHEHASGDWVMFLYADEELVQQADALLREILEGAENTSFFFSEFSCVGESSDGVAINLSPRLIKKLPHQEEPVHEKLQARAQEKTQADQAAIGLAPVQIRRLESREGGAASQGKIEENIELLQQRIEADPYNPETMCRLGAEYIRLKDFGRALDIYSSALSNISNLAEASKSLKASLVRNIALCLKALGRHKEALEFLREARDSYPDYIDLLYIEGQLNLELKDYGSAVSCFNGCLDTDSTPKDYASQPGVDGYLAAYMLAKAHVALRNDAGAISAYRRSLERNPRHRLALLELGLMLARRQSADELKQFLEPLVDLGSEDILVSLALIFTQGGHFRQALRYLDMLEDLEKTVADPSQVAILRGECLLNLGQYRKSIIALNEVAWSSEHFVAATIDKTLCYFLLGEQSSAARSLDLIRGRADFRLAYNIYRSLVGLISVEPQPLVVEASQRDDALNLVADLMRKLLELQEFEICEKAVDLLGHLGLESGEINLFLGKIYYDAGQNDRAIEKLILSYEGGYADGEAFFILGQTSLSEGFLDEAKVFFFEALGQGIEEYGLYISLARTLIQIGELKEALDVLNTGERKYPDAPLISEIKRDIIDKV